MANKKNAKKKSEDSQQNVAEKSSSKKVAKASSKDVKKASKKASEKKGGKPGFFARVKAYLTSVRSEMKRVVWPTRKELFNYSVAVIASLVVVGVVIAVLDLAIGEGLVFFAGLRG